MHILVLFLLMCVGAESHNDGDRQLLHDVCYRCARDQGLIMESILTMQNIMEKQNTENKELKAEIMNQTVIMEEMQHQMERQNTEINELKAEIMNQTTLIQIEQQEMPSKISSHITWTVIQRRVDGSVSFDRLWKEYQAGFGDNDGNFWIGLEKLHELTYSNKYFLRVDMMHFNGSRMYAEYSEFRIGSASEDYKLHVAGYNGTGGDGLEYHNGMLFSTRDKNQGKSCPQSYSSGWWFNACFHVNLNGVYSEAVSQSGWTGVQWGTTTSDNMAPKPLKFAEMKIRPL